MSSEHNPAKCVLTQVQWEGIGLRHTGDDEFTLKPMQPQHTILSNFPRDFTAPTAPISIISSFLKKLLKLQLADIQKRIGASIENGVLTDDARDIITDEKDPADMIAELKKHEGLESISDRIYLAAQTQTFIARITDQQYYLRSINFQQYPTNSIFHAQQDPLQFGMEKTRATLEKLGILFSEIKVFCTENLKDFYCSEADTDMVDIKECMQDLVETIENISHGIGLLSDRYAERKIRDEERRR